MHHGLSGFSTYGLKGHGKGDEHPIYTQESTAALPLPIMSEFGHVTLLPGEVHSFIYSFSVPS